MISIILQIIAAAIAIRFMKLTKYRLSWILLSLAFVLIAARTFIQLIEYFWGEPSFRLMMLDDWLGVSISILIIVGVVLIRELFYSLKRAEIQRARAEKRVINAIIRTEENEKKRFAKDLHDGLGPILSSVKMSLSALEKKVARSDGGSEILGSITSMTNEAISALKDISNNLSPHILTNFGPASAIRDFTRKINQTGALEIEFKTNMEKQRLDPDTEVVLYRAACELINNSIQHSGATHIDIELTSVDNIVTMQFIENGKGFDPKKVKSGDKRGMGLSNIETRVRSVNGIFILESEEGEGTSALIKLTV